MARSRVVLDNHQIVAMLKSPAGLVGRDMWIRGERVKQAAIRYAPVRTGNLRNHIVKRLGTSKKGDPQVQVGIFSGAPYAVYVHEGTRPHIIRARNAPLLVFYWPKVGRVVAFPFVHHPGNRPNRFLVRALAAAA